MIGIIEIIVYVFENNNMKHIIKTNTYFCISHHFLFIKQLYEKKIDIAIREHINRYPMVK